jgi:acyl-CoA thioesterase
VTFAEETRVRAVGGGAYAAVIAEGWDVLGNTNGGYLLTLAARASMEEAGRPDPVSVTAHYLRPSQAGEAEIGTTVLKEGRRFATVSAMVRAGGQDRVAVLGSYGDLEGRGGFERMESAAPDLPAPERCVRLEPTETFPPPVTGKIDLRLHPDDAARLLDGGSGEPRVSGWFRLGDGEPMDTVALLLAVDVFPPTSFNARLPVAWTPTLELTAHVRARPVPGWLRCQFSTRFITGGFLEEDGEVWDDSGRLVAQSRQLALLPESR